MWPKLNARTHDLDVPPPTPCSPWSAVDVLILDRPDIPPAGAGETPIIAVAPAIANAIRAATSRRLPALSVIPDRVVRWPTSAAQRSGLARKAPGYYVAASPERWRE